MNKMLAKGSKYVVKLVLDKFRKITHMHYLMNLLLEWHVPFNMLLYKVIYSASNSKYIEALCEEGRVTMNILVIGQSKCSQIRIGYMPKN